MSCWEHFCNKLHTICFKSPLSYESHLYLSLELIKVVNILCCIFWQACCAPQTLIEIVIFSVFCAKKQKKQEICNKILSKTRVFKFAPERWSTVVFFGNKTVNQHFGANLKNMFFCQNLLQMRPRLTLIVLGKEHELKVAWDSKFYYGSSLKFNNC